MKKQINSGKDKLAYGRVSFGRLTALLLTAILILSLAACGNAAPAASTEDVASVSATAEASVAATPEATPEASSEATETPSPSAVPVALPTQDRAGNAITVPANVTRIISMAPSFTESLIAMGLGDKIVAIELNASPLEGVNPEWPVFDMMAPDAEKLLALKPDLILASPMSMGGGEDPFKPLKDTGICIAYIPSSNSIQGIRDDLAFLGALTGSGEASQKLIADMDAALTDVAAIGKTITDKKRVYFEIAAAPAMYSFGGGVFLNEMIEMIGAENAFADQQSWIAVTQEAALSANPDVILTNVSYIPNPVDEIKTRDGWDAVKAVKDGNVFYIDNMTSSLPNQGIVKALHEMAKAVYPDKY